jgi:predicted PurR-regulated permease PerM
MSQVEKGHWMLLDRHALFWLVVGGALLAVLHVFSAVLLPFVAAFAIAYFLDPIVDRLERAGVERWVSALLVLTGFAAVFLGMILLLVPLLRAQLLLLAEVLPQYLAQLRVLAEPFVADLMYEVMPGGALNTKTIGEYAADAAVIVRTVLTAVISNGLALVEILSLIAITPVISYYLLRDWNQMTRMTDSWLPRRQADIIRAELGQVDQILSGFIRGQASVCLILSVFYAVGLSLMGLNFGLVIGLVAGLISFIPFVGSVVGFIAAVGVATVQWGEPWMIGAVAIFFVVGQAFEGNYLTPKLVGDRVGLHPAWVIFALMASGASFGFLGLLLAVPVAAVIGVVTRFGLKQYLESEYYVGHPDLVPTTENQPSMTEHKSSSNVVDVN